MAYPYQKHIWVTKEIIRREYLQNIEDGIYDEQQERLLAEQGLSQDITDETNRAKRAEQTLTNDLDAEVQRATGAESGIASDLTDEVTRATGKESELSADISSLNERLADEVSRAQGIEASLQESVDNLNQRLSTTYKAGGSIYFASLPPLEEKYLGYVYDIKDAFTTTSDFIEGAGNSYPIGTNVGIISVPETTYTQITPVGDENPNEEGWYEYDSVEDEYFASEDTEVESGKDYYVMLEESFYYDVMAGAFSDGFYLQQDNIVLSTSEPTTVTFSDARITSSSMIEAYTTVDGLDYNSMSVSTGSCTLTFEEQETSITISVKIWVR